MLVFVEILERLELVQGLLAEENPDQPELLRRREVEQRRPLGDLVAGGNVPALTAVAIGPVMEGAADIVADDLAADADVRAPMLAISGHRPDCTVFSAIVDEPPRSAERRGGKAVVSQRSTRGAPKQ